MRGDAFLHVEQSCVVVTRSPALIDSAKQPQGRSGLVTAVAAAGRLLKALVVMICVVFLRTKSRRLLSLMYSWQMMVQGVVLRGELVGTSRRQTRPAEGDG